MAVDKKKQQLEEKRAAKAEAKLESKAILKLYKNKTEIDNSKCTKR